MHDAPTTVSDTEPTGKAGGSTLRVVILWLAIFGFAAMIWLSITDPSHQREISYNELREMVGGNEIESVTLRDRRIYGVFKQPIDGEIDFELVLPFQPDAAFVDELAEAGITVYGDQLEDSPMLAIFLTWGPVLLIVGLWVFFMRRFARQGNERLSAE